MKKPCKCSFSTSYIIEGYYCQTH
uniref:Uncharacterized protein n=1 Tax=Anguilla anguilla TaxID=7936 RepID=A0A0E9U4R2_ANGAN